MAVVTAYVTLCSLLMAFQLGAEGVTITSIKVPPAVENGSSPVVLDCEYSIAAHERQGLVVQWFFRDHPVPVYQWIPGKRPQDNGPLKGRLNLEHRASEDPYQRHRALEIIRPSTDLGGDYRCKVATFDNEDTQSAHMVVYVPAQSFTVDKTKPSVSTVNVTCKVEGIYPEPHLELIQEDGPHGSSRMTVKEATLSVSSRNGRYDATLYRVMEDRHLPADTAFECLLSLPDTEYQTAQKLSYQPGASTTESSMAPPPDNDIDEDRQHDTWNLDRSGGGTSIPSVSAPHRSLDSVTSDGDQNLQDDETTDMWQSGRGIRAHDPIADNGANLFPRPPVSGTLLVVFIVAKYFG